MPNSSLDSRAIMTTTATHSSSGGAVLGVEEVLAEYFPPKRDANMDYSEADIHKISSLLQNTNTGRHIYPRLYIVLRLSNKLRDMSTFIEAGETDISLPYSKDTIPLSVHPSTCGAILKYQPRVMTEDSESVNSKHKHVLHHDKILQTHYQKADVLGSGGFGLVMKIKSHNDGAYYAVKLIKREKIVEAGMRCFTTEVNVLRRADHGHIVRLVSTFTSTDVLGFIMSPVAACNLTQFLRESHLRQEKKSFIWTYFGCLTNALYYLHNTLYVRHKDIKPSNILVDEDNKVLLADFGLAHDFSESFKSTTAEEKYRSAKYCAPEGMNNTPRNNASDIWSLGCIFLEMMTILRGESLESMERYFRDTGTGNTHFKDNPQAVSGWIERLEQNNRSELQNLPITWIKKMLRREHTTRPNARTLMHSIWDAKFKLDDPDNSTITFYYICCEKPLAPTSVEFGGLHRAIEQYDVQQVTELLQHGANLNETDIEGRTVLHVTAEEGRTSLLQLLIEQTNNVNLNSRDKDGRTPLHVAAEKGNTEVAKALIHSGADVNIKETIFGYTPLHTAAWFGSESIVQLLLENEKTDLTAQTHAKHTALSLAELWKREDIVSLLKNVSVSEHPDSTKTTTRLVSNSGMTVDSQQHDLFFFWQ